MGMQQLAGLSCWFLPASRAMCALLLSRTLPPLICLQAGGHRTPSACHAVHPAWGRHRQRLAHRPRLLPGVSPPAACWPAGLAWMTPGMRVHGQHLHAACPHALAAPRPLCLPEAGSLADALPLPATLANPSNHPPCRSDLCGLAASLARQALPCHFRITTAASASRSSSMAALGNRI